YPLDAGGAAPVVDGDQGSIAGQYEHGLAKPRQAFVVSGSAEWHLSGHCASLQVIDEDDAELVLDDGDFRVGHVGEPRCFVQRARQGVDARGVVERIAVESIGSTRGCDAGGYPGDGRGGWRGATPGEVRGRADVAEA